MDGHDIWAAADLDTRAWPTLVEPQTKAEEALKGFDGAVWFRKELELPTTDAGKDLIVHLANAYKSDTTFFNGVMVGETQQTDSHDYSVPGKLVKAGRNVIAVRIKGSDGFVGMYSDDAAALNAEMAGQVISLAGAWSYQPGPDLAALPEPSAFAKLRSDPTAMALFNGMIAPLTPYRIKGAIWYQGESNADRPTQYRTLFPALIRDWRLQWGYDVPFLFVQLAGFQPNKPEPADYKWAELREAQGMALSLPNTGMATAVDIGDEKDIHPRDKQDVAHRLALAAARVVYGEKVVNSGPFTSRCKSKVTRSGSSSPTPDRGSSSRTSMDMAADLKSPRPMANSSGPRRGRTVKTFWFTTTRCAAQLLYATTGAILRTGMFSTRKDYLRSLLEQIPLNGPKVA